NVNGIQQTLNGYFTNIITDLALDFLDSVPANVPFLLVVTHKAAHVPLTPFSSNDGKYVDDNMPLPSNFFPFQNNYPSFIYPPGGPSLDSGEMLNKLEKYYETLYSVDSSMK